MVTIVKTSPSSSHLQPALYCLWGPAQHVLSSIPQPPVLKLPLMHSRILLNSLCSPVLSLQQILMWLKPHHEDMGLWMWGFRRRPFLSDQVVRSILVVLIILTHKLSTGSSITPKESKKHCIPLPQLFPSYPHLVPPNPKSCISLPCRSCYSKSTLCPFPTITEVENYFLEFCDFPFPSKFNKVSSRRQTV